MRYQMNRLRTLAANFQLQRETTLTRHANTVFNALGTIPAAFFKSASTARHTTSPATASELAETLCEQAASLCPGHSAIWL